MPRKREPVTPDVVFAVIVVALIALRALGLVLREVAAWREARWRSADVEAVRAQVRSLEATQEALASTLDLLLTDKRKREQDALLRRS